MGSKLGVALFVVLVICGVGMLSNPKLFSDNYALPICIGLLFLALAGLVSWATGNQQLTCLRCGGVNFEAVEIPTSPQPKDGIRCTRCNGVTWPDGKPIDLRAYPFETEDVKVKGV